jgi:hypothetical protein
MASMCIIPLFYSNYNLAGICAPIFLILGNDGINYANQVAGLASQVMGRQAKAGPGVKDNG